MKAIILCAGYAIRLYPLTENMPKALLPIKNKPLLSYTIERLEKIKDIDRIYIVTNNIFYNNFIEWKNNSKFTKEIKIINDETTSNENRLGGIGDLNLVIEKEKLNEDILVILGDNLFDFNLKSMIELFKKSKETILGIYEMQKIPKSQKLGIVKIKNSRVISIKEDYVNEESNLISTGLYIFSKSDIGRIKEYMQTNKSKEGPGFLIQDWLSSKEIHAFVLQGNWFDIGTKEVYEDVNKNWNDSSLRA